MADRFDRLFQLPPNLYIEGSPVILAAGALLKDNETGSIIAQLKFHSVSQKPIKAVKVSLSAYDVSRTEIQGVSDYQYLEMNISNGQEFGGNKAIVMPNAVTRSFTVASIVIVFNDGSVWESQGQFATLPTATSLSLALGGAELEKQYRIATNENAKYSPAEDKGLWQCSCGTWNGNTSCSHCCISKARVFSALDIETLTAQMNARLAADAEHQRIAAEKESERKAIQTAKQKSAIKKLKVATAIIIPIIVVVLLFSQWLLPDVIRPAQAYKEAEELFEHKQYEAAIEVFEELGNYKDSPARIQEVQEAIQFALYSEAEQLLASGQYEAAIEVFQSLGEYKDSPARIEDAEEAINAAIYSEAEQLLSAGQYEAAIKVFQSLGNYKDCSNRIEEAVNAKCAVEYAAAELLLSDGKIAESAIAFAKLNNYSDAESRSMIIWEDIVQRNTIAAGWWHTVGVKNNGTVVATGGNLSGECNVSQWTNIVSLAVGVHHTVGLKANGTVVATGSNSHGQCNVENWKNIVAVAAGDNYTIGLCSDGTVLVACNDDVLNAALEWTDIIAISSGENHIVGLTLGGQVVAAGDNNDGQCNTEKWNGIVSIGCGYRHTLGIKGDGTVVETGDFLSFDMKEIWSWTDVVAVTGGFSEAFGIKSDGTVVTTELKSGDLYAVVDWSDIVAIAAGSWHTIGLKSDGTVVAIGDNDDGECNVSQWSGIRTPD